MSTRSAGIRKRISFLTMAFVMALTFTMPCVYATEKSSQELLEQQKKLREEEKKLEEQKKAAEREKKDAQSGLSQVNENIREISEEKDSVNEAINDLNDDLVSLIATIAMIEEEIADTKQKIEETQAEYEEAKKNEEEQYAAMKARARFMYEKGGQDMLDILIRSSSISEFLNRANYVKELYTYDRRELDNYIATKEAADALGNQLMDEEAELQADHYELEQSQADMEEILAELQTQVENYDVMIAHAKQDAARYQMQIKQQASEIDALAAKISEKAAEEAEVKKAAEAAKKREEEEKKRKEKEAKKKAEEEKKKQEAEENGEEYTFTEDDATGDEQSDDDSADDGGDSGDSGDSGGSSKGYAAPGSATGSNIAAYACQFVGNPYVAGGTSLTNGCDCSGFVMAVYRDFGISVPRTSWSLQKVGTGVSLENARAGDIVCYAGHVGIYLGNGQIVHASTQRTGIKYGNVNYKTIITIRRVV